MTFLCKIWTLMQLGQYKYFLGCDSFGCDCLFEIRKMAVCFLWLSLPGDYRVTDEALLAETT